mgnify:CR=1 FL=1
MIKIKSPVTWIGNKTSILHILYALFPIGCDRYVEPFGGSGAVLLGKPVPDKFEVFNDYNHNLVNLFRCMRDRPMEFIRELGFLSLNSRDDFAVLKKFFEKEEFTEDYLKAQLDLTEIMLPEVTAKEVRTLYSSARNDHDLRRAAMFLKLIRYSYSSGCKSFLTAPEYFTYSPELVTVTEEANGAVTLSFSNEVTNYKLQQIADPEDRNTVYHLEVWTSAWDRAFHRPGVQAVTAAPESGKPLLVYFTQFINGHAESSSDSSVCIYGTAPDSGGWVALAGLSLGYWLLFNIALFLILIGVWFKLRRKEKSRRWVERLLPIPIAYGLGHLCVMGFRTASCSEWRDFQLILAVGVLFYCAMLLALSIFYNVKELRGIKREGENE